MTEKLYYSDSYTTDFTAKVVDILADSEDFLIVLDKSAFFPGGGGQPCDIGLINYQKVYEVFEKESTIYHRLKCDESSFSKGDIVICSVDSELRFERMRAHTGEHIVSGVAHNKFGVDNVGFHMDESCLMTVDFDKYLDNAKIEQLEKEVNKCVMNNLAISCNIYSVEEAEKINFRSKIDFSDNVRIVSIEGIDNCACCAPHLKTTSEVGIVKILSSASHRGGVRINLICGMKAYEDLSIHYKQILNISALLCSKHNEADIAVEKLIENNKALKYRIDEIKTEYFKYIASTFEASEIVFKFFDDFSSDDLRNISNFLAERHNICSFLFSGNDTNGYSYCISSQMLNLKLLCKDFNTVLNGHGGGRGLIFQGRVKATAEQIKKFIDEMSVDNYADA